MADRSEIPSEALPKKLNAFMSCAKNNKELN
jgi:hypothetical protein